MERQYSNRRDFIKTSAYSAVAASVAVNPLTRPLYAQEPAETKDSEAPKFAVAQPVWAQGREEEMNVTLAFYAAFDLESDEQAKDVVLRVAGSSILRIHIGREYVGYGPARGPHGWFRVDEWDLSKYLKKGQNLITIEVSGYNCNSFDKLDQPSFLQPSSSRFR